MTRWFKWMTKRRLAVLLAVLFLGGAVSFVPSAVAQVQPMDQMMLRLFQATEAGQYQEAVRRSDELLRIMRNPRSLNQIGAVALVHAHRGRAFGHLGQFEKAEENLSIALGLLNRAPSKFKAQRNLVMNSQAVLLIERGRFEEAERTYKRLLSQPDVGFGERLLMEGNLVGALLNQGKLTEAKTIAQRLLAEIPKTPPKDGSLYLSLPKSLMNAQANVLGSLAEIARSNGELSEAKRLHEQVLEIRRKSLGPNHPDVAVTLNNLGVIATAEGAHEQALVDFQSALAIVRPLSPTPMSLTITTNIADTARELGDLQRAIMLYEGVVKDLSTHFPISLATSDTLFHNLGLAYFQIGQPVKAEEVLLGALRIRQGLYSGPHPFILSTSAAIGWTYIDQGRPDDALYMASHLEKQAAKLVGRGSRSVDVNSDANTFISDVNMLILESAWAVSNP